MDAPDSVGRNLAQPRADEIDDDQSQASTLASCAHARPMLPHDAALPARHSPQEVMANPDATPGGKAFGNEQDV